MGNKMIVAKRSLRYLIVGIYASLNSFNLLREGSLRLEGDGSKLGEFIKKEEAKNFDILLFKP
jgi:hypothetical protein